MHTYICESFYWINTMLNAVKTNRNPLFQQFFGSEEIFKNSNTIRETPEWHSQIAVTQKLGI